MWVRVHALPYRAPGYGGTLVKQLQTRQPHLQRTLQYTLIATPTFAMPPRSQIEAFREAIESRRVAGESSHTYKLHAQLKQYFN